MFNLRSWASNRNDIQTQATSDNVADTNEVVNLLGLKWSPSSVTQSLNPKLTTYVYRPGIIYNKREVLRLACKTYDPLGLYNIPSHHQSKSIYARGVEAAPGMGLLSAIVKGATQTTLPRSYFQHSKLNLGNTKLHVFADASTKAYGAVSYLSNGNQTSLVISKSRVAPLLNS